MVALKRGASGGVATCVAGRSQTETLATLDAFCDAMIAIAEEARTDPDPLHRAPLSLPGSRVDEANAAKCLNLCWTTPRDSVPPDLTTQPTREIPDASTY